MKKLILLCILIFLLPLYSFAQKNGKIKFDANSSYKGMILNKKPMGEGVLTFKWSKDQIETVSGVFNGNTVSDAKVVLIPEDCYYSGLLSYEIDSNGGIMTLKFIKGVITLNTRSYNIANVIYISDCKDKSFSLGRKISDEYYDIDVEDENATPEYIIDFYDFYNKNRKFPLISEYDNFTIKKIVERKNELMVKQNNKTIEVVSKNGIPNKNIVSTDGEVKIFNQKMTYKLSESLQLCILGYHESVNKFKVTNIETIDLSLRDNTKIKGKVTTTDLYSGSIIYSDGSVFDGRYHLHINSSFSEYVRDAIDDYKYITVSDGKMTNSSGTIITIDASTNNNDTHNKKSEEVANAKNGTQQKEDSDWNSIPLMKYSGPYQLTASKSKIEGYASYFYRVVDGERVYDKEFNFKINSVTISGQYKKGIKSGKWIYDIKHKGLRLEVNYINGRRNGIYKYIQYDKNGNLLANVTLKMSRNYVIDIIDAKITNMIFSAYDDVIIKNAQINAVFASNGYLDEISEIIEKGNNVGKFKFYERWSFGSLKEKYYYNNMTGDKITLKRESSIINTIRDIIDNGYDLAESIITRGFDKDSDYKAWKDYYFHINWIKRYSENDPTEWDYRGWGINE